MKKIWITLVVLISVACSCLPSGFLPGSNADNLSPFSEIRFCEDVSDSGQLSGCKNNFPAGTRTVWAYFTYSGMQDGQTWGRIWYLDQQVYIDSRSESWEDGNEGWIAYSMEADEPQIPLSGNYRLELLVGESVVSSADFYVAPVEQQPMGIGPAIGTIQFASDLTDDLSPIGLSDQFESGTREVYAVFPFIDMNDGLTFTREWIQDGEVIAEAEMPWEEGSRGLDYASLYDEEALSPGVYTLNLYIDGQLARSAGFEILGTPQAEETEPGTPEELIDQAMLPAWENLATSDQEILRDLAQFALNHHIKIYVDPNYDGEASYRYSCDDPPIPGEVVVSETYWNEHNWEEVTSTLGHELTHAVQHLTGNYRCGCSIEKEYYAWITGFYVLQEMDRMDILEEKYRGVVYDDTSGRFDGNKLWDVLQDVYSECPDY